MKFLVRTLIAISFFNSFGQTEKPKLIVGVVVDQMRYDYLTKFENRFGDNGF